VGRAEVIRSTLRGSVVGWGWLEDDSFDLGECVAAESECGLEAFGSEFAGVERSSEFVERGSFGVEYLFARGVEQDQVSRAPQGMREADVSFAFCGVESLEGEDDGLFGLESFADGAGE
jgi:hypothetical protein